MSKVYKQMARANENDKLSNFPNILTKFQLEIEIIYRQNIILQESGSEKSLKGKVQFLHFQIWAFVLSTHCIHIWFNMLLINLHIHICTPWK